MRRGAAQQKLLHHADDEATDDHIGGEVESNRAVEQLCQVTDQERRGEAVCQRTSGSGASAYFAYLPSTLPTTTSNGKTSCCTSAGISSIANSVR